MEKAIEWVKNHKQHTAAIVIVVVAVIAVLIAAASGAFTQQDKTKDAIKKGDETLKGDAGTGILNKLDGNVNANPNVSDETKENAPRPMRVSMSTASPPTSLPAETPTLPAPILETPAVPTSRARLPTSIRGNSTPRRGGYPTW